MDNYTTLPQRFARLLLMILFTWIPAYANQDNILNVYTFAQEIPDSIIAQFEKESGIKVNYTAYDTNEVMYSKLRAAHNPGYDVIEPSSYYVDRMRKQNMLEKLDKTKLSEYKNLDPFFLNVSYDPNSQYSVPFVWGITGIFANTQYFNSHEIKQWSDLFNQRYNNQLMLLNDPREAFSMALLMLGYSINDQNPQHILQAYYKLRALMPNVRLFNTDAVTSILIDEDATIGIAWNGDLMKAHAENSQLSFIYPQDGFEIWVDNFAILQNAPHRENAYKFINFMLRPEIAKAVSMEIGYATANLSAKNLLPLELKNNAVLYPANEVLKHGQFETDIGDETFALLEKYWERLKMEG